MKREKAGSVRMSSMKAGGECPIVVVGIGASAGGLRSLRRLFEGIPKQQGAAYVLVQHLDPRRENLTLKLLADSSALPVVEATEGMPVFSDRIHVIPPGKALSIAGCCLSVRDRSQHGGLPMPIDSFFCSLALDQGHRACGIVLSGAGNDGSLGLAEIKAAGGLTISEDPSSAEFPSMPKNAAKSGAADLVLPPGSMREAIAAHARRVAEETRNDPPEAPRFDARLRDILDLVREDSGHDFMGYKPTTLVRRIRRRMELGNFKAYSEYAAHMRTNQEEAGLLRKDLLIGVTEFFRQKLAWEALESKAIAELVD